MNIIDKQKLDAKKVQDMVNSDGWSILEIELNSKVEDSILKLLEEKNLEDIYKLQSEIKAIKTLIEKIVNYGNIDIKN